MIHVFSHQSDAFAVGIVRAALERSVSAGLVQHAAPGALDEAGIALCINPDPALGQQLLGWLAECPRKLILFGRLPEALESWLGVRHAEWPAEPGLWSRSALAPTGGCAESIGQICYSPAAAALGATSWCRALERFDFTDEWNNLAYGAIRADGGPWALAQPVRVATDYCLAELQTGADAPLSYCALRTHAGSSVLWFNRPVGPVDSFEWRLVENFLSTGLAEDQPCCPVIREIPWGYDTAITMRLDCDEDITSARPLWEAYRAWGVPLSLAIHTVNLQGNTHHAFLREFCAAGGALLSHTATHAPNWGGSYEAARHEGHESRQKIETATGVSVRYAVSPFHQSPPYALAGLCDAGYLGCIGGIIRNDPEFLLARGGELDGLPRGFIGHSQQTMLHGDCMLTEGDPLRIFKAAYDRAYETQTLFGYLDHPFSPRYQYGWSDEAQRIEAHRGLIAHIRTRAAQPLFLDEIQALDFLRARAAIRLIQEGDSYFCQWAEVSAGLAFGVEYQGRCEPLLTGKRLG